MHICDPSIQEVEEEEVLVQGQPGLQREALFWAGGGAGERGSKQNTKSSLKPMLGKPRPQMPSPAPSSHPNTQ